MKCDVVDLSSENGTNIHWGKVRAAGVGGIILRGCVGVNRDKAVDVLARGALSAGLRLVAVYGFVLARTSIVDQAKLLLDVAQEVGAENVAMDQESDGSQRDPRGRLVVPPVAPSILAEQAQEWPAIGDTYRAGVRGIHYSGVSFMGMVGAFWPELRGRCSWGAHYDPAHGQPNIPNPCVELAIHQEFGNTICQFPDGSQDYGAPAVKAIAEGRARLIARPGIVDGINGEVDVNVLRGGATLDDLALGRMPIVVPDLKTVVGRQQAMRLLGTYTRSIDGQWGGQSEASLRVLQTRLGLALTGYGPKTEAAIVKALGTLDAGQERVGA